MRRALPKPRGKTDSFRFGLIGGLLLVGWLSGCGTTYVLPEGRYTGVHREIARRAERQWAQICFWDGAKERARGFRITADSLLLPDGGGYPLRQLRWIRFRNPGRAFLRGAGIGAVAGAIPALGLWARLFRDAPTDPAGALLLPVALGVAIGGTVLSMAGGAFLGGLVGLLLADPDTYWIRPADPGEAFPMR